MTAHAIGHCPDSCFGSGQIALSFRDRTLPMSVAAPVSNGARIAPVASPPPGLLHVVAELMRPVSMFVNRDGSGSRRQQKPNGSKSRKNRPTVHQKLCRGIETGMISGAEQRKEIGKRPISQRAGDYAVLQDPNTLRL